MEVGRRGALRFGWYLCRPGLLRWLPYCTEQYCVQRHSFPDCYQDVRYGGTVCKPGYHIVQAGFLPPDPLMVIIGMRMSYRDEGGIFVREDDHTYLRNKWRPEGAFNLIEMDIATDEIRPVIVGDSDPDYFGSWEESIGRWTGAHGAVHSALQGIYLMEKKP